MRLLCARHFYVYSSLNPHSCPGRSVQCSFLPFTEVEANSKNFHDLCSHTEVALSYKLKSV